MRIARWSTRLMRFNYTAEYKPGHRNVVADALSRLPQHAAKNIEDDEHEVVIQMVNAVFADATVSKAEIQAATASDQVLQEVIAQVSRGWSKAALKNDSLKPFYMVRDELAVLDNCLFRGDRLVVPLACCSTLIAAAHSAHQGIVRTKQRLRELYWWPRLDKMVEESIRECFACQASDKVAKTVLGKS